MIKQNSMFLPSFPLNTNPVSETMLFGELDPDLNSGQIMDWLEDSIPYLPSLLDDLYDSSHIIHDPWWAPLEELQQDVTISTSDSVENLTSPVTSTTSTDITTDLLIVPDHDLPQQPAFDLSKKRKAPEEGKRSTGNKKGTGKSTKDNCSNGDGRWAEQLLNPCAAAMTAGNVTRVQHLLFVLHELASPTGDANYRLASQGLQALLHHLSSSTNAPGKPVAPVMSFTTATPKFLQRSLITFNDINPWFTIPFNIANNAILQVLSEQENRSRRSLHILDIGVSHGFQWPTLLEALSRRTGGPPPLVRLTVVSPSRQIPFANCPSGYDFTSNILRFAKDLNINLQINTLDNCPLQTLNAQIINSSPDETLIVCAQFRFHDLSHTKPDNRTEVLKLMRSMEPDGVILSDNNMDCSCNSCSTFDAGFSRRLDYLWSFLDSTSVAFKGRDMEERKVMEGEAAKALVNMCETERKEKWGERMKGVGFVENAFGEDVIDQARSLLKKYDSHWEMRVEEEDECVGLWWKGQSVSFCSLWKIDPKTSNL